MGKTGSQVKSIKIGNYLIGQNQPTYLIAEIGINHNGDVSLAKKLIDVAAKAKVNAVKFQKRNLEYLYLKDVLTDTNKYEQNFQYMIPILKNVELTEADFFDLKKYSNEKGLEFLCTPFDLPSVDFLDGIGINAFKIASADLSNLELIEYVANKKKPMIISTGMSYWEEIEKTVTLVRKKNIQFALLHCRSSYPVWPREVNLKMINRLSKFSCPVGYSGHDIGIIIPLIAASMGACIIEKHITLDKKMSGPDHKISLEPFELERMVRDIRVSDQAMGKENRFLLRGEILNRELFGKSLFASADVKKGDTITRDMIKVIGPGKGLSPSKIGELIGKEIRRDIPKDHFFIDADLNGGAKSCFSNSFRTRWGLIARFNDVDEMLCHNPKVLEFHLTENDLDHVFTPNGFDKQELVVHVPEYMGEHLFDLCSEKSDVRKKSVHMVQRCIKLAKMMSLNFSGIPKIIAHPGAMSLNTKLDKDELKHALLKSLSEIDTGGLELLLENLPPYPWYFGGQWKGNFFLDAQEIAEFCESTGTNICFDISHAALFCNAKGNKLAEYIDIVKPFIRHIHFADAYGLDGEGVQIGEGDINFEEVMPLFDDYPGTWVPEIWRGHLNNGNGFIRALTELSIFNL